MTCVALPCCLVQSFEPPVPAWPVGKTALLEALAEWVRDEARAVGLASRMDGGAAKRYVKMLGQWAGRIGEGQAWAIPRVGADLRRAALAGPDALALMRKTLGHQEASLVFPCPRVVRTSAGAGGSPAAHGNAR